MQRRTARRALGLLLLLAALWPLGEARSTTVEALEPEDLVARAEAIVWGDVVSVRADWDERRARIYTHVEVAPRETLKGQPAPTVTLKLPGGEVDGVVSVFHGMPRFRLGEEVVLHVTSPHARTGVRLPVGLGQGVHRVLRPGHGPAVATRDTRELHLVRPGVAGGQPGGRDARPLDDLLQTIRAEVARQRGGPR
ncbi:MAG: hypothetical protein M9894_23410 [Planctomycetes bacterium]|nr:hypothetical protein [Planctomycetota bacterium]